MTVMLVPAEERDAHRLWQMQVEAFSPLFDRYGDEANPAREGEDKVLARIRQPFSDYYLILADRSPVGGVRVVRRGEGGLRISPLFVIPAFQNQGVAQTAMRQLEALYPQKEWELNTILEEEGNCHLYEKMGYRRTGAYEKINDRMTLVYYRK